MKQEPVNKMINRLRFCIAVTILTAAGFLAIIFKMM